MMQSSASAKGLFCKEELETHLYTLREEDGERGGDAVNVSKRETKIIYCLGGTEMLKNSLTLGSVYSHVKGPLRKL